MADFVDSLALENSTRDKLDDETIFALLRSASGAQFDPQVVRAMHAVRPQLEAVRTLTATHRTRFPGDGARQTWWHELRLAPPMPVHDRTHGQAAPPA